MTCIRLAANDQKLSVIVGPKLASGDIESVSLYTAFSGHWKKYEKSAVFFTSWDKTAYEVIMDDDNECVIPHEVLRLSGDLYIGIRGVDPDTCAVKTSSLVKYRIEKGAPPGSATSKGPTPDVYQQLLQRLSNIGVPENIEEIIAEAVEDYFEENPISSGSQENGSGGIGISNDVAVLLITILEHALYSEGQAENIRKLKEALKVSTEDEPDPPDEPDIPDEPDEPDEPDDPVITKLETPVIRLETVGEPDEPDIPDEPDEPDEPDVPEGNTPAILGIAILGRTILGDYGGSLPKLAAPVIRLEVVEELPKLTAPVIRLETDTEPDDPEEPDEPEIPKLDAPNIRLMFVAVTPGGSWPGMGGVTTNKLAAPVIYTECDHAAHLILPIKDPTCVTPGTSRCLCIDCAHTWDISVPATGVHDYRTLPTAPTCTEQGYTTHTCHDCGESYVDSYVDATGHDWNDGVVTKEPTEQETGILTYTCNKCGDTRTEVIPVLDHVHSYVATVTNPTCIEQGFTTHTCTCGDSYKDSYVDALDHDWGEPYYSDEFVTGYGRKCNRCGALDVMMQKLGAPVIGLVDMKLATPVIDIHDYSSTVVEPTCTTQGYTLHSCACGDSYTDTFVDALGHDWGEVYKSGDEYVRDCKRCGEQETGAEQYLKGRISIEAVASGDTPFQSDQVMSLILTPPNNGYKQTLRLTERYPSVNLTDAPLGQYTISARAGYGWIDGYELTVKYTVQYGNAEPVETQTFVLTPEERNPVVKVIYHYEKNDGEHVHSYVDTVTNPKCTTRGYTTHTCMCGDTYDDSYVNALGHDWSEPYYDGDEYVRVCNRCGARQSGFEQDVRGNITMRIVAEGESVGYNGQYRVQITPPDGFKQTQILYPSSGDTRLINVPLGDYHFEALPGYGWVDGYDLTIKYSVDYVVSDPIESQTATLTSDVPTVNVTVTYHYEKITEV